jgi:kynureninase
MTTRAEALALDAADPLAGFRDRFVHGDEPRIYLDGNSLGRLPVTTRDRLHAGIDDWGDQLVTGWHTWIDAPRRVGDVIADSLLGVESGQVLVGDSTTVNLYKLCGALTAMREGALLVPQDEFPTDRYVLQGLADANERELRLLESDPVDGPTGDEVERALSDGDVAFVVLSHVNYRSGALAALEAITSVGRAHGVPVVWDLCHSVGVVPLDLAARGAELAVGCTYKYLNAGPGAPAFLYIAHAWQARLRSPIQGWFAQEDQFAMGHPFKPRGGIEGFLAGTPPILDLAAVEEGVKLTAEAGLDAIRAKSVALTELLVELHDERLAALGFSLGTPRDPARRGSHVSLRHPDAWPICRALIERAQVVPDFRAPDSVRFGVPPLYTRFVDVWEAVDRLCTLVEAGDHERLGADRSRVT